MCSYEDDEGQLRGGRALTRHFTPNTTSQRMTLWKSVEAALSIVVTIIRDASLCSGVAWIVNMCLSQGNVLSSAPVKEQSYTSFMGAEVVTTEVFTGIMMVVTLAQAIRHMYVVSDPEHAPPLWLCIAKLAKRTIVVLLGTLLLMACNVYILSFLPVSTRFLKLEFYVNCVCGQLFFSHADLTTRLIIRQEILTRGRPSVNRPNSAVQVIQPMSRVRESSPSATTDQQQQQPRQRPRSYWRAYWRHFFLTSPMMVFVLLAGLYVHTTRDVTISGTRQTELVLFTVGSTMIKMGMQELAKRAAIKRKINNARSMCIIVGVPTVLIDTQIRLVVQRIQTTQSTISGTVLMALIEIVLRSSKLGLTKLEIYHHDKANLRLPRVVSVSPVPSDNVTATVEVTRWKCNVWKLYMAETYADMAAEYIAIGCSASIMFFYGTHPKYQLSTKEATLSALNQFEMVTLQVVIEVLVDLVACTLEISHGMDFREVRKDGAFMLTYFALLAVINIQISSYVYVIY